MKTLSVSKIVGFFPLLKRAGGMVEALHNVPADIMMPNRTSRYLTGPPIGGPKRVFTTFSYTPEDSVAIIDPRMNLRRRSAYTVFPRICPSTSGLSPEGTSTERHLDDRQIFGPMASWPVYRTGLTTPADTLQLPGDGPVKPAKATFAPQSSMILKRGLLQVAILIMAGGAMAHDLRLALTSTTSTILVQLDEILPKGTLDVFNTNGRPNLRKSISDPLTPPDLSGLPSSMYILRYGNDRTAFVKHIIKQ